MIALYGVSPSIDWQVLRGSDANAVHPSLRTKKLLHMSVTSVIVCYIHTQSNAVIKNNIFVPCNQLRLHLHPSFGGTGVDKKMGAGVPWHGLSIGVVCFEIRGRFNLIMKINDPPKLLSSKLSQYVNKSSLDTKHAMP